MPDKIYPCIEVKVGNTSLNGITRASYNYSLEYIQVDADPCASGFPVVHGLKSKDFTIDFTTYNVELVDARMEGSPSSATVTVIHKQPGTGGGVVTVEASNMLPTGVRGEGARGDAATAEFSYRATADTTITVTVA